MANNNASVSSKGHRARNFSFGVLLVLVVFVALLATRKPVSDKPTNSPLIGKVAPDFQGQSIIDGSSVSLSKLRSGQHFVLLNFFGSYCIPCRLEHPELVKIAAKHKNVEIISVTFDDNPSDAITFFKQNKATWPLLNIERIAVDYGVAKIPESFLISPDGLVLSKAAGAITAKGFDDAMAKLVGP